MDHLKHTLWFVNSLKQLRANTFPVLFHCYINIFYIYFSPILSVPSQHSNSCFPQQHHWWCLYMEVRVLQSFLTVLSFFPGTTACFAAPSHSSHASTAAAPPATHRQGRTTKAQVKYLTSESLPLISHRGPNREGWWWVTACEKVVLSSWEDLRHSAAYCCSFPSLRATQFLLPDLLRSVAQFRTNPLCLLTGQRGDG